MVLFAILFQKHTFCNDSNQFFQIVIWYAILIISSGQTILHKACEGIKFKWKVGCMHIATELLKYGLDINQKDNVCGIVGSSINVNSLKKVF